MGCPETLVSIACPVEPKIVQRVSGDNAYAHSSSATLAASPETSMVTPCRFGTEKETGDALLEAPNVQLDSAIRKKLVVSGWTLQGVITVSVLAVLEAIVASCPAPVPAVIRTVAPLYRFTTMLSVLFPTVVGELILTSSEVGVPSANRNSRDRN